MILTPSQVAAVAAGAGFRGEGLTRAVAVALAESGGNTQAVNVNSDATRSRDRGLWQINSRWHPEVSDAAAFDPAGCAAAAYRISSGGASWSAWSTWKNGAAASQLGRAQLAASSVGSKAGAGVGAGATGATGAGFVPGPFGIPLPDPFTAGDAIAGAAGAVQSSVDAARALVVLSVKAGAWIVDPHNWLRVAMVTGGSVGVLLALRMIADAGGAPDVVGNTARAARNTAGKAAGVATMIGTGGTSAAVKAGATVAAAKGIT